MLFRSDNSSVGVSDARPKCGRPRHSAAKAEAAVARKKAKRELRKNERKAAAERQWYSNWRHQEGFGLPLYGFPLPTRGDAPPLGDGVIVDAEAGVRCYVGRGSLSNSKGHQQDFLGAE